MSDEMKNNQAQVPQLALSLKRQQGQIISAAPVHRLG